MVNQSIFSGGVRIRSLNGYLIAVNGEVFATTNTGGTTNAFFYQAKTTITSGDPGSGHLIWNNATQISATQLNVSHLTDTPIEDIDLFLSAIVSGNKLVVQDRNDSGSYQSWTVSGAPTQIGSSYWTIPVTLLESQGTGTTGFANNHDLLFAIISGGTGGGGITTNSITFNNSGSGAASGTSFNGGTAVTISYNTIGAQQASASLSALAGLTYASGTPFVKMTGAGTFALDTNTYITGNQTITLSGDVTGSGATAITTTIANNAVTLAKMAQVATARFLGRVTAGTGNVEALTGTQATTLLDTFTSALKGLAPASGGGTTNFLRADGTWAAPPGGSGTPAGSNTQIQYNNSGAFGASTNLVWNGTGVGIFNASPFYALSIGDGTSTRQVVINGLNSGTAGGSSIAVQTNSLTTIMFGNKSNVIGGAYDGQPLFGYGGSTNSLQFYNFNTLAVTAMISSGDRFLIGTTTDNGVDRLQVSGNVLATLLKFNTSGQSSTISNKYQAGTSGFNIFIGNGGGSISGTSGDQSSYNVSLGHDALLSLTTGLYNFAIGAGALKFTTTGYENVAVGKDALAFTTTGYSNTAVGTPSMVFNTTGYKNTAIGWNSLVGNTTGYSNVAIGVRAGYFLSGGANNQTASQSVYIGEDTRASAAGNTNEIVIGHNAIGQGSNSVTLGNSSITQTLLRGTVTAGSYVKSGGTNSQVLYADGSTKQITSGTAAPTGGNDGDIYLQYDVSLLTGSGTANYIPKFTSATAIGNSQIFDDGTNVGIGTTSPAYPLQVRRAGGAGSLGISIDAVGNTDRAVQYFSIQDNAAGAGAGHAFYYRTPNSTTDVLGYILDEAGNIGINQNAPAGRFVVADGQTLLGTNTNNGTDRLQVNGSVQATQYSATVQTLTDGATITFDAANGSNAVVTLGGNRTLAFSNTRTGAYYTLRVIQDGTGSRTLAMPGTVKVIGGGAGVVNLTTTANAVDIISFYFDGTTYWASFGQNYT